MELSSNDLLNQLTSRRLPDEDESNETMSRAILRVLRHGDESLAVRHDCFGLISANELVTVVQRQFQAMTQNAFTECLERTTHSLIALEKIEYRGEKIRALYGHSLRRVIVGEMKWPETKLFHATRKRHLGSILNDGLRPQRRTWVHLTTNERYADTILQNHDYEGRSVLLKVVPDLLEDFDVTFRKPNSHVWLANRVPPAGIIICQPNSHSEVC